MLIDNKGTHFESLNSLLGDKSGRIIILQAARPHQPKRDEIRNEGK
jgi:hypothetical protein